MSKLHVNPFCSECPHIVLLGIACDGHPVECPLHLARVAAKKGRHKHAFVLDTLLEADEFDAVRSRN